VRRRGEFDEILEQVITLLKRQGRVSYRALKLRFDLDDEYLDTLKEEILYVHQSDLQADDRGFTWTGETEGTPVVASQPVPHEQQPAAQETQPTAEPLPTEHRSPEAERRQLTVMFCDLVDSTKLSSQLDLKITGKWFVLTRLPVQRLFIDTMDTSLNTLEMGFWSTLATPKATKMKHSVLYTLVSVFSTP
jgi:hypothetical protein